MTFSIQSRRSCINGLIVAFNSGWLILVLAYAVRKLPFNVRASSAILHQLDPSLEGASINLGVSPPARSCS